MINPFAAVAMGTCGVCRLLPSKEKLTLCYFSYCSSIYAMLLGCAGKYQHTPMSLIV